MADRTPPSDVTDAELAVLRLLWEHGTQTRRQLTDALYPSGGPAHYTTVQKLLERLQAKGYVESPEAGPVRTFRAVVARNSLIRRRLRDVANELCDGAVAPLFMQLIEAGSLSETDVAELRALVRKLGKSKGR